MKDDTVLLSMQHIHKSFPGVKALTDVSLDLHAGEVHCLIGENGAGKSTLIKCLAGQHMPEEGTIEVEGRPVRIVNAQVAISNRIGIIHQEFNLVPTLSVAENIYLGREFRRPGGLLIDRTEMYEKSEEVLKRLGLDISSRRRVAGLTTAQQQMVEIAKAVSHDSKIIVFDEPTAVLTQRESDRLFQIIAQLKEEGAGIIYISHRLDEVLALADRITALRDGKITGCIENAPGLKKDDLVAMMVGRTLESYYPERTITPSEECVFEAKGFEKKGVFHDVSFRLHKGEILGLSGLVGAGRTETMRAVFGVDPCDAGEVYFEGERIATVTPQEMIRHGIVFLPEDRKREGLILSFSAADNLCVPNYDQVSDRGLMNQKKKKEFVEKNFNSLMVRPSTPERLAVNFSGGNQQKLIIAKWLARNPKVLILDEPTRGIDVNAKAEIYNIMNDLTEKGMSIIVISSEMVELIGICDRIMVMYEGKIVREFLKEKGFDEKEIGRAQMGAVS